jgi:hypothetical protein
VFIKNASPAARFEPEPRYFEPRGPAPLVERSRQVYATEVAKTLRGEPIITDSQELRAARTLASSLFSFFFFFFFKKKFELVVHFFLKKSQLVPRGHPYYLYRFSTICFSSPKITAPFPPIHSPWSRPDELPEWRKTWDYSAYQARKDSLRSKTKSASSNILSAQDVIRQRARQELQEREDQVSDLLQNLITLDSFRFDKN